MVRRDGHVELVRQAARFDGVEITDVRVPASALDEALRRLDPDVRRGLEESIRRLRSTCEAELPADVETALPGGGRVTTRNGSVALVDRAAWLSASNRR